MDIRSTLHVISTLILLAFGVISLVRPGLVANASSMSLVGGRGVAEFRIAFGGFFAGLALAALIVNQPVAYQVTAVGWFGAALTRAVSYFVDKPTLNGSYIGLGLTEFFLGVLLLV